MKTIKNYSTIFCLSLAGLLVTSCNSDEAANLNTSSTILKITTNISSALTTRSVKAGTSFASKDVIGVCVYNGDGTTLYNSQAGNQSVTYDGSAWNFEYPVELTAVEGTVYGYYPYSTSLSGKTLPIDLSTDNDYMWAESSNKVSSVSTTTTSTDLTFHHALTRVSFQITRDASSFYDYAITGVSLSNNKTSKLIANTGSMSIVDGSITKNENTSDVVSKTVSATLTSSAPTTIIETMLIPVSMGTDSVKLSLVINNTTFEVQLKNEDWKAGYHYTYPITIYNSTTGNKDDFADNAIALEIGKVSIVDWVDETPATTVSDLSNTSKAEEVQKIDLGLTSGTLWASRNLGGYTSSDYGSFFSWGECTPKSSYTQSDYVYYRNGSYVNLPEEISGTIYDVAHKAKAWGDKWTIPTKVQWQELIDGCNWTIEKGTSGSTTVYTLRGTSKTNKSTIDFPFCGYSNGTGLTAGNSAAYYWTSTLDTSNKTRAYYFHPYGIYTASPRIESQSRYYGMAIRPVYNK